MRGQPIDIPAFLISALRGGSGKTVISIGIISALLEKGFRVSPFKKGPDYIDAGWLTMAAGRSCHNLDTYLFPAHEVHRSFFRRSRGADISVIEGNRGLFDGLDVNGSISTAQLARDLRVPVILCIDCTKSTRTMAALVGGCQSFDPKVAIKGVILNRVAGSRHESILRQCIETYCNLPVIGAVGKLAGQDFPERHMGLVPTPEHAWATASIDAARRVAEQCIDMDAVLKIARTSPAFVPEDYGDTDVMSDKSSFSDSRRPVICVARDSAFQFYYPENIEAIKSAGGEVRFVSPLSDTAFPEMDALYIGGGFPETHAGQLSQNNGFKEGVRAAAEAGMPVYAECGGLMYLGEALELAEGRFPMTGVFPMVFGFHAKPQGHGYTRAVVTGKNPFFPKGCELFGHEFHYSRIAGSGALPEMVFSLKKGKGIIDHKDAVVYKNVLATYTHIHALGNPGWAAAIVDAARDYRERKGG